MAPVLTPGNDVLCYSYNTATLFKYGEMPPLVTLFFPSDPECLGVEVPGGNLPPSFCVLLWRTSSGTVSLVNLTQKKKIPQWVFQKMKCPGLLSIGGFIIQN